jgi:hypothetical protein
MAPKKTPKPDFTLEVVGATVEVQILVRNADGKASSTKRASIAIMAADLEKHNLTDITLDVERQLNEQMLNPTKAEG